MHSGFKLVSSYFQAFLHLFYPHVCLQCGEDLINKDQIICDDCETQLPFTHFEKMQDNPIEKIFWGRSPISNAFSVLYFSKESLVQEIIFELKYRQNKKAAYLLGKLLANRLIENEKFNTTHFLIPIPIAKRKIKKRGFNQTKLICEAMVANGFEVPIYEGLLATKMQVTQTKKDRIQRSHNMDTPFTLSPNHPLTGKNVLLVDDVITTGATLEAAIVILNQAKPARIQVVTAAFTYHS